MTVRTVSVAPEYVSFYISGTDNFTVPLDHDRVGIVATRECRNVSCLHWNDGDTTITLGPFKEIEERATSPKFDGYLDTPENRGLISDAIVPAMLSMSVPETPTRVRIWTNHPTEPDDVVIALG